MQVASRTIPGQGRGLYARTSIRRGEPLLRIPEQLVITTKLAEGGGSQTHRHPLQVRHAAVVSGYVSLCTQQHCQCA
jgi:hypothetical protein